MSGHGRSRYCRDSNPLLRCVVVIMHYVLSRLRTLATGRTSGLRCGDTGLATVMAPTFCAIRCYWCVGRSSVLLVPGACGSIRGFRVDATVSGARAVL